MLFCKTAVPSDASGCFSTLLIEGASNLKPVSLTDKFGASSRISILVVLKLKCLREPFYYILI